jgi:hypothetical protein
MRSRSSQKTLVVEGDAGDGVEDGREEKRSRAA